MYATLDSLTCRCFRKKSISPCNRWKWCRTILQVKPKFLLHFNPVNLKSVCTKVLEAFCRCEQIWRLSNSRKTYVAPRTKHPKAYISCHFDDVCSIKSQKYAPLCTLQCRFQTEVVNSFNFKQNIFHLCKSKHYHKLIPHYKWGIVKSKWEITCNRKKMLQHFPP